ncbi:unnamed protein product [Pleuronectes platessa]|uniref:Uncharacterized protein n=1 Tax=Pleuronectes platessa TaxID=8262 RepID=A0A9N7VTK9_PLEPL|nr:unnamed protein product [Pleuronectes platessa]
MPSALHLSQFNVGVCNAEVEGRMKRRMRKTGTREGRGGGKDPEEEVKLKEKKKKKREGEGKDNLDAAAVRAGFQSCDTSAKNRGDKEKIVLVSQTPHNPSPPPPSPPKS